MKNLIFDATQDFVSVGDMAGSCIIEFDGRRSLMVVQAKVLKMGDYTGLVGMN